MSWPWQLAAYALVGVAATAPHYAVLAALVELLRWDPVPAALMGYAVGGIVSYILNRRHTFASERRHEEASWRFALAAFLGFCCTYVLMSLFVERLGAPYLLAQIVTTIGVMFLTFAVNRAWTFGAAS